MAKKLNVFVLVNEAPETVGIISSVLEGNGSVDTAVRKIAESGPSESRALFRKIVEDADLRIDSDIENAVYRMLSGLPEKCSPYSMSVRMAMSATRTTDNGERTRILKEASDISLNGLKDIGKSFSSSLNTPCMVIFGLGIMVPMILMSIVPMMGISGLFSTGSIDTGSLSILTLVLIPAAVLVVISGTNSRNPLKTTVKGYDPLPIVSLISIVPLYALLNTNIQDGSRSFCIAAVIACMVSLCVSCFRKKKEDHIAKIGTSLEKCIFEIGNRLLSGTAFEPAVDQTLSSHPECSFLGKIFIDGITANRGDVGTSIKETFRPYSDNFCSILTEIYEFSKKDPRDAGRLAMSLGRRNEDRESLRRNIRHDLKNMTDTMFGTAAVFAPLVLGLSVSMMVPLSAVTAGIDIQGTLRILSLYLCELCGMISLMLTMIDGKCSVDNLVRRFTLLLPISMTVFLTATGL